MNEWDKCNSSPAAYKTISHKPHAECGSHLELPNEDNSTGTVIFNEPIQGMILRRVFVNCRK